MMSRGELFTILGDQIEWRRAGNQRSLREGGGGTCCVAWVLFGVGEEVVFTALLGAVS